MKHFSEITFIRYSPDQNVGKPKQFEQNESTRKKGPKQYSHNPAKVNFARGSWDLSFNRKKGMTGFQKIFCTLPTYILYFHRGYFSKNRKTGHLHMQEQWK